MASSSQAGSSDPADSTLRASLKRAPTDQRSCWICMDSASENPDAAWANPCNCSLEAHEACLLRWVAETEQSSGRPKNGLLCPQCKALIQIVEPYDSFVVFRDRLHRTYSRMSPIVLLLMLSSGAMAGSAWYGLMATNVFAGSLSTAKWLTSNGALLRKRTVPLLRWKPFWMFNFKLWIMSLVGPTITIVRAFPPLGNLVCLPASILYGCTLVFRDNMPSWPPSPEWAMTLMPVVHLTYQHLYYEFFGTFEKKLNRALRGRPEAEEPRAQQQAAARGQGAGNAANNGHQEAEEDPGMLANILALGRAIWGLFGEDGNNAIELEARIHVDHGNDHDDGEEHHEDQGGNDAGIALQLVVEVEEEGADEDDEVEAEAEAEEGLVDAAVEAEQPDAVEAPIVQEAEEVQPIAAEPAAGAVVGNQDDFLQAAQGQARERAERRERRRENRRQRQDRRRNRNGNGNGNRNANRNDNQNGAEDRGTSVLNDICNGVVTSLMYPVISYGIGELLHHAVPKAWVTSAGRKPTGLLQQRWGRSLAGGCLFVVLRDVFVLYTKYRRVQVKKNRRIRNVETNDTGAALD